jgi:hypothetical protein
MRLSLLGVLTLLIVISSFLNVVVLAANSGLTSGRDIDVFTQYSAPYGGQGRDTPSNPFRPLTDVFLYANVTYNLRGVAEKIVTFKIEHGEWSFILTNTTNSTGIAWMKFKIPWPDTEPEARVLGIWNITATVDIADVVVVDKLWFYASLTDLNRDGKVDIRDLATVAIAFGSFPGNPRWNPIADLDNDGKIDTRDLATEAKDYGWHQ